MKRFFSLLCFLAAHAAHADTSLSRSLISGNALMSMEGIQKAVQGIIVQSLSQKFSVNKQSVKNQADTLSLQTEAADYSLKIPQKPALNEILTTLGVSTQVQIHIDPIETTIDFGADALKIDIKKTGNNLFRIHAHWEIKKLMAKCKSLKVIIPKGAFDRAFAISSNPVRINLIPELGPLTADISLTASLTTEGSQFTLESFKTNLSDEKSRLKATLGTLTMNGSPLELEIMSNGHAIKTNEATIRSEFQNFEPELMQKVQKQLATALQEQASGIAEKLRKEDPFKLSLHSSSILSQYSFTNPTISSLFRNISVDFILSYLQEIPNQKLFSAQLSSKVCIDSECLKNRWGTSQITNADLFPFSKDSMGILIYESWLQNILNSDAFQKRVGGLYRDTLHSPGTSLGKNGVKIHFNPVKNAISAVLNLKIDIKETVSSETALQSWANFIDFSKKHLADFWENIAGSGQYIYLPVEINIGIKGIQSNPGGKRELLLIMELPFHADGSISNTYGYQSNVEDMTPAIREQVLTTVEKQISAALPKIIKIPVDSLEWSGIRFNINQVLITKNKGLLISGGIQ